MFFGNESIRKKRIDGRTAELPGRQADPVDDDQLERRSRWTLVAVRRDHCSDAVEPACIGFYFHSIRLPQHHEINSIDGRVLRAETEAVAACVLVQSRWGDLSG